MTVGVHHFHILLTKKPLDSGLNRVDRIVSTGHLTVEFDDCVLDSLDGSEDYPDADDDSERERCEGE